MVAGAAVPWVVAVSGLAKTWWDRAATDHPRAWISLVVMALLELASAMVIVGFVSHQTAHYFMCG